MSFDYFYGPDDAEQYSFYAKEISSLIRDTYGGHIKVFNTEIPRSVRAAEISSEGKSIFLHDPKGKVAEAYGKQTVKELIGQNQGVSRMPLGDASIRDFEREARKYGVDFAVTKDKSVHPPQYTVFFKARDNDALQQIADSLMAKQLNAEKNPFAYIHSEKDILKLVTALIANTKGDGKAGDEFWTKAETLLYTALIGYIHYEAPENEQNFATLLEMLNSMDVREDDEDYQNPVDMMFEALRKKNPNHFAVRQFVKFKMAAGLIN